MKSENIGKIINITVYVLYGLTALFFLTILCMYRNIKISVAVLKTSAVIIIRNIRTLLIPFISFIFIIGFIAGWLVAFGYLMSCANIIQPTNGSQLKSVNLNDKDYLKWQIGVFVFGLFWIAEFLAAVFKYCLIVGVCTWYFTSTHDSRGNFTIFRGLWWAFRYNFGSLALGSFLLAVIWTIRLIFEYVDKKLKNLMGNNQAAACISNCIRCCLACFHKFIKFLNDNAYIQVGLTGDNFCTSAMAAFALALKNAGSFMITNGIGSLISFLGKVTIAVVNTFIGYLILTKVESIAVTLDSPIGPMIIIFIISYLMAKVFMSVYSTTSLTILQCLYADVDILNQKNLDIYNSTNRPAEMEEVVNMLRKKE